MAWLEHSMNTYSQPAVIMRSNSSFSSMASGVV